MVHPITTVELKVKQRLVSGFQEIESYEDEAILKRFLPSGAILVRTDNSNLVLVMEVKKRGTSLNMLDRVALAVSNAKDYYYRIFGKKMKMTQDDAVKLSVILNEQSKKLEGMAVSYRIMASALMASKDDLIEVIKNSDERVRDYIDNPF